MSTGKQLLTKVRDLTRDRVEPYKFSDDLIIGYLADGITILCKQAHVLVDTNVPLSIVADKATYKEPERVLKIYAIRISGETTILSEHVGDASKLHVASATAEPRKWSTNLGDHLITFTPVPDDAYTLEQLCAVKPKARITKTTDSKLEEDDEAAIVKYAASQCLLVNDIDGINPGTAAELFNIWRMYVIDRRQEIYRYRTNERAVIDYWAGVYNG